LSLTNLKEKLITIGAKIVSRGRHRSINRVRSVRITRFESNPWVDCVQVTRKNAGMRHQTAALAAKG